VNLATSRNVVLELLYFFIHRINSLAEELFKQIKLTLKESGARQHLDAVTFAIAVLYRSVDTIRDISWNCLELMPMVSARLK
jgi:hypothetical protein